MTDRVSEVLAALASSPRRLLLLVLAQHGGHVGAISIRDLAVAAGTSSSTAKHHLLKLKAVGLVDVNSRHCGPRAREWSDAALTRDVVVREDRLELLIDSYPITLGRCLKEES